MTEIPLTDRAHVDKPEAGIAKYFAENCGEKPFDCPELIVVKEDVHFTWDGGSCYYRRGELVCKRGLLGTTHKMHRNTPGVGDNCCIEQIKLDEEGKIIGSCSYSSAGLELQINRVEED